MAADKDGFKNAEAVVLYFEMADGSGIYRYNVIPDTHRPVKSMAALAYEQSTLTGRQVPWAFLGDKIESLEAFGTSA